MILSDIIAVTKGKLISGKDDINISAVSTDTRKIREGELFIAIRGERFDGHNFIDEAIKKGANAIIIDNISTCAKQKLPSNISIISVEDSIKALGDIANWHRRSFDVFVIAITGSTGKTTTKEILASILGAYRPTHFTKENLNNLIGLPLNLLELNETHRFSVLEMGMNRPGEIARLTEISEPDMGIITNVGPAHIEAFGSMEGIISAKLELLKVIKPFCPTIIDGDNEYLVNKAKSYLKPVVKVGLSHKNDYVVTINLNSTPAKLTIFSNINNTSYDFTFNIPVFTYLRNAATACSAAILMGVPEDCIQKGLNEFRGVKKRFEIIKLTPSSYLIDDSYNANPLSLQKGLQSLKKLFGDYKLILCIGDMLELGTFSDTYHQQVGIWCADINPYHLVILGEYSEVIMKSALNSGLNPRNISVLTTIEEAYHKIKELLTSNTAIYIKGSNKTKLYQLADKIKESLNTCGGKSLGI